jgi:putative membrane protein
LSDADKATAESGGNSKETGQDLHTTPITDFERTKPVNGTPLIEVRRFSMKRTLLVAALAMAATCLWLMRSPALADDKQSSDQTFMQKADEIDMAEAKLGKVAEQDATSRAVKKFGERMVQDHSRMNKELREIAGREGISLPRQLDQRHQALLDQLSQLKGIAFDRAYTRDMVSGHQKAIEQFEAEAKNGRDPQVKAWAEKSLPILREHLRLARDAVKDVQAER